MSPHEREQIRMMFGGRCAYCGVELPMTRWHVDHLGPVLRSYKYGEWVESEHCLTRWQRYGNGRKKLRKLDNPENHRKDNLWPSCRACNINKSSMPLEAWRKFLMEGPESLASYNGRFRHMLRFGIVTVNQEPLKFWFQRYGETREKVG